MANVCKGVGESWVKTPNGKALCPGCSRSAETLGVSRPYPAKVSMHNSGK